MYMLLRRVHLPLTTHVKQNSRVSQRFQRARFETKTPASGARLLDLVDAFPDRGVRRCFGMARTIASRGGGGVVVEITYDGGWVDS